LKSVHEQGYIHRDVKPDNVMLGKNLEWADVKVVDFGLATKKLKEQDSAKIGTILYMAPE